MDSGLHQLGFPADFQVESVTEEHIGMYKNTGLSHLVHASPDVVLKVSGKSNANGKTMTMTHVIELKAAFFNGGRWKPASEAYVLSPYPLSRDGIIQSAEQYFLPVPSQYSAQAAFYSHILQADFAHVCICTEHKLQPLHFITIPEAAVVGSSMYAEITKTMKVSALL